MAQLLPRRPSVERGEGLRLEAIDDEAADEVFDALSSGTARSILGAVYDEPAPASELAEAADTSLQNARYHIEKLVDAELIEPADTWYSEQGREMTVYAPADESLVMVAGEPGRIASLRGALQRVVGAVAILAAASLVAGAAVRGRFPIGGVGGAGSTDSPATPAAGGYEAAGSRGADAAATGGAESASATPVADGGVTMEATSANTTNVTAANGTTNGTVSSATPTANSTATPLPTTESAATPTPAPDPATPEPVTTPVADAVGAAGPPPELVFFLGGLFVLTMVGGWLHWSGRWSAAG